MGDEQGALSDCERRLGADPDEAAVVTDPVAVVGAQLLERRPPLALRRNVLARVLANRAAVRVGRAELGSAGDADR